jgi:hypothetical protein
MQPQPEDPYAFLPKPGDNNMVHTAVNFSDGRILRIANTAEVREGAFCRAAAGSVGACQHHP